MAAKLNQIIAIEKGVKTRTHAVLSEMYKTIQKPTLFNGMAKSFKPLSDDGEKLPSENVKVQYEVESVLKQVRDALADLMSVTARKDFTNTAAKADVKVGDVVIAANVPVTYLLFMEKQLTDLRTFIGKIPVLDEAENWAKDENSGLFKSDTIEKHRTKKVQRPLVMYDATDKHPAQTQLITEDVITGHWNETKLSGALPKPRHTALSERIELLIRAVKTAREEANMQEEVKSTDIGSAVFNYLLAKE